jgi:hypothetical protein
MPSLRDYDFATNRSMLKEVGFARDFAYTLAKQKGQILVYLSFKNYFLACSKINRTLIIIIKIIGWATYPITVKLRPTQRTIERILNLAF